MVKEKKTESINLSPEAQQFIGKYLDGDVLNIKKEDYNKPNPEREAAYALLSRKDVANLSAANFAAHENRQFEILSRFHKKIS